MYRVVEGKCPFCKIEYSTASSRWSLGNHRTHHITPKRYGGTNKNNTINLCNKCHHKLHRLYVDTAIKLALKQNPEYFYNCIKQFGEGE